MDLENPYSDSLDDFMFEELHQYKLTVTIDDKPLINTSNNREYLKGIFDEIIRDNLTTDNHIVISIYDYEKDTNVEYYNSDDERV